MSRYFRYWHVGSCDVRSGTYHYEVAYLRYSYLSLHRARVGARKPLEFEMRRKQNACRQSQPEGIF